MIIKTFGTKTVHETLESCEKVLKLKISLLKLKCTSDYCDETVLQKKAADFKGQQLTFTYDETVRETTFVIGSLICYAGPRQNVSDNLTHFVVGVRV